MAICTFLMADLKEGGDAGGDGGNGEAVLTKTDDGIAFLKVSSGPTWTSSLHQITTDLN